MTQKEITDVFTDAVSEIGSVRISKGGFFNRLFKRKKQIELSVGIIPAGKVQKIGTLLKSMADFRAIANLSQADQINTLLSDNIPPIIEIIALSVAGPKEKPCPELVSAISNQWGMQQIHTAFIEVYRRLDLQPFFDILSLSKNLTLNLFPDKEAPGQA